MNHPRTLLTLCTGNVARSVLLAHMLDALGREEGWRWEVRSAGTHAVEGAGISARTRDALVALGELGPGPILGHRSHQVEASDLAWADLTLCVEASQGGLAATLDPDARVVSLGQFVREADLEGDWTSRVERVSARGADPRYDVVDPAGGDQSLYDAVARELWELAQALVTLLGE